MDHEEEKIRYQAPARESIVELRCDGRLVASIDCHLGATLAERSE